MESTIVAAGKTFDIGCKVVQFTEDPHFSFYKGGKYGRRPGLPPTLSSLQEKLKHLCFHHSVDFRSRMTYNTLVARGLSVHFMIDDDINEDGCATIYQGLDLKDIGYSQAPFNDIGVGVEISYHPAAWTNPNLYSESNRKKYGTQEHEMDYDTIHGARFHIFKPTTAQLNACAHLAYGINQLIPEIKLNFPTKPDGTYLKTILPNAQTHSGLISHFNLNRQKIDPIGFDFKYVEDLAQTLSNPVC